jgi:8-oxo-dGTP pyrophosphatase MutT (NUDIX family)
VSTDPPELRPPKTLSRRTVYEHGKYLTVESHTVQWPDGQVIPDWAWVIAPDAAIVLAMTSDDQFICFRQTKYAVDGTSLAPVAGMIEPGEEPLAAAKRELLEETGYEASDWTSLGSYKVDPNRGVGVCHLFLAKGAAVVTEPDSDDIEDQTLLRLTRSELEAALVAGEFKILSWAAVVSLALNRLK